VRVQGGLITSIIGEHGAAPRPASASETWEVSVGRRRARIGFTGRVVKEEADRGKGPSGGRLPVGTSEESATGKKNTLKNMDRLLRRGSLKRRIKG